MTAGGTRSTRVAVESVLGHPLSDEQWAAVSSPAEPSAIVAGAGSGKTTVMSARVLWLVMEGLALPDEILGLMERLNREMGKTILMVTHDPVAAARAAITHHLDKGRFSA